MAQEPKVSLLQGQGLILSTSNSALNSTMGTDGAYAASDDKTDHEADQDSGADSPVESRRAFGEGQRWW